MSWLCNCLLSLLGPEGEPYGTVAEEGLYLVLTVAMTSQHTELWRGVTKPMFVFEFEGELLPFIVNGDRFELLALLPRRKPRTERSIAAAIFPSRGQPSPLAVTITSRVWRKWHRIFVWGGRCPPLSFRLRWCGGVGRQPPPHLLAISQRVRLPYRLEHRCRNRCSCTRTRASSCRPSQTETGTSSRRGRHAGSHGQNGC